MILVHAGNRVDRPGGGEPRFPAGQVDFVKTRLRGLLELLGPTVVSAAAAGADLLLLECAVELGLPTHVVLPFDRGRFLGESVVDLGPEWVMRYERVLDAVDGSELCTITEHDESTAPDPFRRGNARLLDRAQELAAATGAGVLALAVRPGPGQGPPSVTDDFVDRARQRSITVIDIDPRMTPDRMRRAFVAMPFGVKGSGRRRVDCDATFAKLIVPSLEDADLLWHRADRELDRGLIHVGMIERLGNADVVLVDTATENPNVFYELGVRHALADRVTVLIGPKGTSPPFDTRPIRHFGYALDTGVITDEGALAVIPTLSAVLGDPGPQVSVDSPVFEFFLLERPTLVSRAVAGHPDRTLAGYHQDVTDAARRGDKVRLAALSADAGDKLSGGELRQVLLRIGIALYEHGHNPEAVAVLGGARHQPHDTGYALWAQHLAMALRRVGERVLPDGDPEPAWGQAEVLLDEALAAVGDDAETYGIAAGLAKQRGVGALRMGAAATARTRLTKAADLYRRGLDAEPTNFYTGLNTVTTLRILGQRMGAPPDTLATARQLLPVVGYFTRRAVDADRTDFWAVVTEAELEYTRFLLEDAVDAAGVVDAYTRAAAGMTKPWQATPVVNQLELYRLVGDPPDLLDRLLEVFADAS